MHYQGRTQGGFEGVRTNPPFYPEYGWGKPLIIQLNVLSCWFPNEIMSANGTAPLGFRASRGRGHIPLPHPSSVPRPDWRKHYRKCIMLRLVGSGYETTHTLPLLDPFLFVTPLFKILCTRLKIIKSYPPWAPSNYKISIHCVVEVVLQSVYQSCTNATQLINDYNLKLQFAWSSNEILYRTKSYDPWHRSLRVVVIHCVTSLF